LFIPQTVDDQYPDHSYEKKRKAVLFNESKPGIGIKIASSIVSLASCGWVPQVTKGKEVKRICNKLPIDHL